MISLATEANAYDIVERPWGYYQVLGVISKLKFKKLVLSPGRATSLQYHNHRDEFWTILSGQGIALIDGQTYRLTTDATFHVAKSVVHQLRNTGDAPLVIHEVQRGDVLEERDIIRLS